MRFLEHLKPLSLLVLRLALGIAFMFHGYPKLISNTSYYIRTMPTVGFPWYFAYIAGVIELFGGGLLVIGLFTRGASLLLAIEMGITLARVHIPAAGIYAVGKYELSLVFFAASFALATTGAGLISIDAFTFEAGRKSSKKPKSKD
jgi:putative oxidoreductase